MIISTSKLMKEIIHADVGCEINFIYGDSDFCFILDTINNDYKIDYFDILVMNIINNLDVDKYYSAKCVTNIIYNNPNQRQIKKIIASINKLNSFSFVFSISGKLTEKQNAIKKQYEKKDIKLIDIDIKTNDINTWIIIKSKPTIFEIINNSHKIDDELIKNMKKDNVSIALFIDLWERQNLEYRKRYKWNNKINMDQIKNIVQIKTKNPARIHKKIETTLKTLNIGYEKINNEYILQI